MFRRGIRKLLKVILGLKKSDGQNDAYFFGKVNGVDRKFIRVFAGLILPHQERQPAAVAVVGELYRSFDTPHFTVLTASVDQWPVVKSQIIKFHQDLKYGHIIAESKEVMDQLWRIQEIRSVISYVAPPDAISEVGRQTVAGLKNEGRFHYDHLKDTLERDPEQSAKAIQCGIMWALDLKAFYLKPRPQPSGSGGYLGMDGL